MSFRFVFIFFLYSFYILGKRLRLEAHQRHLLAGNSTFKASSGWLQKWMKRFNVTQRAKTSVAQSLPADLSDKVVSFQKFIIRMHNIREYPLSAIGNMDETPVFFDLPGNTTLNTVGEKSILLKTTGHEKDRITVALAAMANGKKLPPFVILKGVRPPKKEDVPSSIRVYMTSNGWMNEQASEYWVRNIWKNAFDGRKLLVWDAFRAHTTPSVKEVISNKNIGNSDMAMIPGGCTSMLQPADVSWNKPFKAFIQEKWEDWLMCGEHTYTPGGRMRKPTIKLMLKWISDAWENLLETIIIKSFKKTGISNELDGTEDDLTWESDEDEEFNMPFTNQCVEQAETVHAAITDEADRRITNLEEDDYDSAEESNADEENDDYYYASDDGNATD